MNEKLAPGIHENGVDFGWNKSVLTVTCEIKDGGV